MRQAQLGLGWQSHLLACRFGALVRECDDCIALRTPGNPSFYWGNCLIVPAAPRDEDLAHWLRRFDEEIAKAQSASRHVAIGVDAARLDHPLPSWSAAGFDEIDDMAVLAMRADGLQAAPLPRIDGVDLRRLRGASEFEQAVELQVAARDPSFGAEGYRVFRQRAMDRVVAMREAGIACWYGAFAGDVLAADCGLVFDASMGRFQYVATHPDWRRRGLCRALVRHVCADAFNRLGLAHLVMCADPHDVAIGIYRSVGFEQVQTHWCLQRRPPRP